MRYIAIPLITAAIGYGTNWVAIKMCFHPQRPIGVGPFKWQGIVYRLSEKLASELGGMITSIIDPSEIFDRVRVGDLLAALEQHDEQSLQRLLGGLIDAVEPGRWASLSDEARAETSRKFIEATEALDEHLRTALLANVDDLLDIQELTVELLSGPNAGKFAEIMKIIGGRELKFIVAYGGIFGLAIGIIQVGAYQLLDEWWVLPIVGAIVGAFTNYMALAMIFRPLEPTRFLGLFTYQGMFPARQAEIAAQMAHVTATEILPAREMVRKIGSGRAAPEVLQAVLLGVTERLPEVLEPAIGRPVDGHELTAAAIGLAGDDALPAATADHLMGALHTQLDVEGLMRTRLAEMPKAQFERLFHGIFEEDEGILIVIGAVLGAVTGFVQILTV